jgi:CDGSH iron-sulfur domain-containing protein 3
MSDPEIGGREPIAVEVEAGKIYWWCACGSSKHQPFCHKVTAFEPIEYRAEKNGKVLFKAALRRQPQKAIFQSQGSALGSCCSGAFYSSLQRSSGGDGGRRWRRRGW